MCGAQRPSETPEQIQIDTRHVCNNDAHLVPVGEGDQALSRVGQPGEVLIQLSVAHVVTPEQGLK